MNQSDCQKLVEHEKIEQPGSCCPICHGVGEECMHHVEFRGNRYYICCAFQSFLRKWMRSDDEIIAVNNN